MIYVNVQTLERNKSNKFQSFWGMFLFAYLLSSWFEPELINN